MPIGPVRMCGPGSGRSCSWIWAVLGQHGEPGAGQHVGGPLTVCTVTRSPGSIVRTGGSRASKLPQWQVAGEAASSWCLVAIA